MPSDKAGRVVFVGNIPYGLTEEQVKDILQSAGAVSNFRLVYDKDTGRPKGFGFAEFGDADSAASAVRNLNGHEIMGRTLRVDYSNDDGGGDKAAQPAQQSQQPQQQQQQSLFPPQNQPQPPPQPNGSADSQPSAVLPALPPGVDLPPGITCPDAISQTLAQVPPPQLLDFISQLKGLVMSDPRQVVYLLAARPQLAYAVFQALLLLGLVDTKALGQVVQADSQPQQQPQQQQQQQQQQQPPQPAYQQPQQPYAPQQPIPPQFQLPYQQQMNVSTPPVQNQPYRPPTAPQKPPEFSDFQWEQIRAICSLPQAQVDAMTNITERNTVLQIRQQWGPLFASQYAGVPGY